MIFGESGGIGRPNNDVVVGQCDPIAERERKLLNQVVDVVDLNNSCCFVFQCHLVYSSLFYYQLYLFFTVTTPVSLRRDTELFPNINRTTRCIFFLVQILRWQRLAVGWR